MTFACRHLLVGCLHITSILILVITTCIGKHLFLVIVTCIANVNRSFLRLSFGRLRYASGLVEVLLTVIEVIFEPFVKDHLVSI